MQQGQPMLRIAGPRLPQQQQQQGGGGGGQGGGGQPRFVSPSIQQGDPRFVEMRTRMVENMYVRRSLFCIGLGPRLIDLSFSGSDSSASPKSSHNQTHHSMALLQQRKPTPQNDPNKPLVETRLREMAVRLEDYLWKRSNNNVDVRKME
jgi:hypothetical protein